MPVEIASFMFTLSLLNSEAELLTAQNTSAEDIHKAIADLSAVKDRLSSLVSPFQPHHFDGAAKAADLPTAKAADSPTAPPAAKAADSPLTDKHGLNSKLMAEAIRKAAQSAKIHELLERLEEIHAIFKTLGVDTKYVQDGSDLVMLYLKKMQTPRGTMCSKRYMEVKQNFEEDMQNSKTAIAALNKALADELKNEPKLSSLNDPTEDEEREQYAFANKLDKLEVQIEKENDILSKRVLAFQQHLTMVRPVNLKAFRKQFEDLFNERVKVLSELRTLEAELAGFE